MKRVKSTMRMIIQHLFMIFALEGLNAYFMMEQWIPTVELIVRVWVFFSQFYVIYLVYKIIKILNPLFQKRYPRRWARSYISFVGFLFTASFIIINFFYFIIFVFYEFKSETTFGERTFYMYDSSFMDYMIDVSTSEYLVMRKNLITVSNDYNLSLYQQGNKIILRTSTRGDIELYDLNSSENLYGGE